MSRAFIGALLALVFLTSCDASRNVAQPQASLSELAGRIQNRLCEVRFSVLRIRDACAEIYRNPSAYPPGLFPDRVYATYEGALVYDRNISGKSSVLATGATPVTPEVMRRLHNIEHLEPLLRRESEGTPWISMSWLGTAESLGVFNPPFDMPALVPPRISIPSDILPYRDAAVGNPLGKTVWSEPYVDITGKGYMVTVSVPVLDPRNRSVVSAVAGNDVALGPVAEELTAAAFDNRILLSRERYVIAAGPTISRVLGIEALGQVFYLHQVERDIPAAESFRLDRHAERRVRDLADHLPEPGRSVTIPWNEGYLTLTSASVPETGWLLLEGTVK